MGPTYMDCTLGLSSLETHLNKPNLMDTYNIHAHISGAGEKSVSEARERKKERRKFVGDMIYRKWSLLTGPTAILAGIMGTVVVADLLFVENVSFQTFFC